MKLYQSREKHFEEFLKQVKERSDNLMNYFLAIFFLLGLLLAFKYDTWLIGIGVGSLSLIAYYSSKFFLPRSDQYQYVLSVVFGIFMAQFIYQMHGMFEMHFFAFIGSAILITYQNWKLQIPLALVVVIHHPTCGYLQYIGHDEIYFTQLPYMTLETFIIHGILATGVFFLCGLWAHNFKKYSSLYTRQSFEIGQLQEADKQKEAFIAERQAAEKKLLHLLNITSDQNKQLQNFAHIVSHNIRSHSANIHGLISIFNEVDNELEKTKLHQMLSRSSDKLEETIENLNHIITIQNDTKKRRTIVNLHDEIEKSRHAINASILQTNTTIINDVEVYVDIPVIPSYLESILLNLLTNAIKYRSPDRDPVIRFYSKEINNHVVLYIQDNGLGIDLKKYGHAVFGMYKTFHPHKDAKGFGLFITKNQVEAMQGRIEVESDLDVGTVFRVYFQKEVD